MNAWNRRAPRAAEADLKKAQAALATAEGENKELREFSDDERTLLKARAEKAQAALATAEEGLALEKMLTADLTRDLNEENTRAEKAEAELAELRAFKVTALGILEKYGETLATGKALAVLLRAALAARTK